MIWPLFPRRAKQAPPRIRPGVERLERRDLLSASPVSAFLPGDNHPLGAGQNLLARPTQLTVVFTDDVLTAGGSAGEHSVTNPANWRLALGDADVSARLTAITFRDAAAAGRPKAVLTFDAPLAPGPYLLTARGTILDAGGAALDGDRDGTPGGDYTLAFGVGSLSRAGGEFRPATAMSVLEGSPAVAVDAGGNTLLAWRRGEDIVARQYDAAGGPRDLEFRVNATSGDAAGPPAVAVDAAGNFVIVWQGPSTTDDGYSIYARRYGAQGEPAGAEFLVNNPATSLQSAPAVALTPDGSLIVVWQSFRQDGDGNGIYARRFDAAGVPTGAEFRVNTTTAGDQASPTIAVDPQGNVVIAWQSADAAGGASGIDARRYDAAGAPRGAEFRVNTTLAGAHSGPSVATDAEGDFVIAWEAVGGSGGDVLARRFDAQGTAQGGEIRVATATTPNVALSPAVAMTAAGDFVVVWQTRGPQSLTTNVRSRLYAAGGEPLGGEFGASPTMLRTQLDPAVGVGPDGKLVIAWTSRGPNAASGISAHRFQPEFNTAPTITGTAGQTVLDTEAVAPFRDVTVADADSPAQTLTVTVELSAPVNGGFTAGSLNASGFALENGAYAFRGTAAAATAALRALVFVPTVNQVAPGGTVTTTFFLTATDDLVLSPTTDLTSVVATSVRDAPIISGAVANQAVLDTGSIAPFSGVIVAIADAPNQVVHATVTLSAAANGGFRPESMDSSGFTAEGGGVYRVSGTPAQVTAALRALVFVPTVNQVTPGAAVSTAFTIAVTDGAGGTPTLDASTSVVATSVNDAPTITGTAAGQRILDTGRVTPFGGVTIADVDSPAQSLTVTVALSAGAKGGFSAESLAASRFTAVGGVYTYVGTAAAATAALRQLMFVPAVNQVVPGASLETAFTLAVSDGLNLPPTNDTATRVFTTSVNDAPSLHGVVASQAILDNRTARPFAGVAVADVDSPAQRLTVTVTLNSTRNGRLTPASLSASGFADKGSGVYLFTGTAAQAILALRALVFVPAANQVAPGRSVQTYFTLRVNDGLLDAPTTAVTRVVATSVNDAPQLRTPASPALPTISRRTTQPAGTTVARLLGAAAADADVGALRGLAVVGLTGTAGGTWQYSLTGGRTWLSFGALSPRAARLLRATDLVRFVPRPTFAGRATLSFRAWDLTAGRSGLTADLSLRSRTGGSTAFSAALGTASITVV